MKKVFPGDKIQANDYNDIIDAVQKNDHSSEALFKISKPKEVYVKNNTDRRILPGAPLRLSGALYSRETPEKAMHRFISGGAVFACNQQQAAPGPAIYTAFALETIRVGALGRCHFPSLVGGFVYFTNDVSTPSQVVVGTQTRLEFTNNPTASARNNFFNVAAVYDPMAESITRAFCLLVPNFNINHWINVDFWNRPPGNYVNLISAYDGTHIRIMPGETDVVAELRGANWTLRGATNPVVNVTCDSDGNLVVEHQQLNLLADF